jgi:hypothetical protein
MALLCAVVAPLPIGTNLGLVYLLWMMLSGRLLLSRGAILPGLSLVGLSAAAVRRAWAALGQGHWTSGRLLTAWATVVRAEGWWQAHVYAGYRPVSADVTGYWRPRLRECPTKHYHAAAGKALPAIPLGLVARTGSVQGQRLGLPVLIERADPADPSPGALVRGLLRRAAGVLESDEVLVTDREFRVGQLQAAGVPRWLTRLVQTFTARRANPPAYPGRGRPATRGVLVRPLPRRRKGRLIPATPPDEMVTWQAGETEVRADVWRDLVLPGAAPGSPTFDVVAIHDPRHTEPLLLATPLALPPRAVGDLYHDRWPVEQLPLAGKQMVGAARQFVSAPETCQRLPELSLIAGAILSYAAATSPALPTGTWDRRPQRTPGRLRRVLGQLEFPTSYPLPGRVRRKAAVTAHLPTGFWGQRRRPTPTSATSGSADRPGAATPVA